MTTLSHHTVMVEGLRVHYAIGGEGPPVVLLHGWPQTLHEWRHVMPLLAERHTVIAPDLRGHGFSGRPGTGYDANQLGDDVHGLVRALDLGPVAVVGHDFGAVAGYTFAARHREAVTHLAFLEMVLPGLGIMEGAMSPQPQGQFLWHMGFQSVPDIPFTLIHGHEREYLQWFFQYYAYDPTAITTEDLDHYTAAITQVGALRAGLELYQAFFTMGEQIKALAADKLTIPVLAYGGASCLGPLPLQCMELVATDVRGGVAERAGHWIAEERPGFVADEVLAFIAGT